MEASPEALCVWLGVDLPLNSKSSLSCAGRGCLEFPSRAFPDSQMNPRWVTPQPRESKATCWPSHSCQLRAGLQTRHPRAAQSSTFSETRLQWGKRPGWKKDQDEDPPTISNILPRDTGNSVLSSLLAALWRPTPVCPCLAGVPRLSLASLCTLLFAQPTAWPRGVPRVESNPPCLPFTNLIGSSLVIPQTAPGGRPSHLIGEGMEIY